MAESRYENVENCASVPRVLPDGVGRDVEDAVLARDGDVDHRLHGGAVEVVVVLQRVDSYVKLRDQIYVKSF